MSESTTSSRACLDVQEDCQRRQARGAFLPSLRYASLINILALLPRELAVHDASGAGYLKLNVFATSPVVLSWAACITDVWRRQLSSIYPETRSFNFHGNCFHDALHVVLN